MEPQKSCPERILVSISGKEYSLFVIIYMPVTFRCCFILFISICMKDVISRSLVCSSSILEWNPKFYLRDSFPRCFPTYLISDEKPTGVSLNDSGGVVSELPHDLSLWRNVIHRLEFQIIEYMENKLKSKPSLTLVFFGGSMLSGTSHIEFANLSKCNNYSSPFSRGSSLYSNRECAYPARFGDWLQAVYPQANVHIYNFGIGGSMSSGLLTTIVPMLDDITTTIDVVFLHYLNNDALAALHEKNGEVSIGYEDLVRHLLSIGAAVIDLPMHADYLPKSFQLVHGVMSAHQKVLL